jgi:hypothetical protein
LKHFSPIVEIGAGNGYWASLLRDAGCDIVAFDVASIAQPSPSNRGKGGEIKKDRAGQSKAPKWAQVLPGGPEVLASPVCRSRALFLCYPDEYEVSNTSLGEACLEEFQGGRAAMSVQQAFCSFPDGFTRGFI